MKKSVMIYSGLSKSYLESCQTTFLELFLRKYSMAFTQVSQSKNAYVIKKMTVWSFQVDKHEITK